MQIWNEIQESMNGVAFILAHASILSILNISDIA